MKKILICLPSQYYYKYIELDAFKDLQKNFKVSFLLNKNRWNRKQVIKKKISPNNIKNKFLYSIEEKEYSYFLKTLHLFLVANRKLSKSFKYNFRRWYPNLQDFIKIEKTKRRDNLGKYTNLFLFKTFLRYFQRPFLKRLIVIFLSNKIVFDLYKQFILPRLKLNSDLLKIIGSFKPDLIIYTTHCIEPEIFMILK